MKHFEDNIFIADQGEPDDFDLAKRVGEILMKTYPGYLWMVSVALGDIVVKEARLGKFGEYGFVIGGRQIISPTDLREKAIRAGGELLERCGLPRDGKVWDGDPPRFMDGADPRRRKWYDHGDRIN